MFLGLRGLHSPLSSSSAGEPRVSKIPQSSLDFASSAPPSAGAVDPSHLRRPVSSIRLHVAANFSLSRAHPLTSHLDSPRFRFADCFRLLWTAPIGAQARARWAPSPMAPWWRSSPASPPSPSAGSSACPTPGASSSTTPTTGRSSPGDAGTLLRDVRDSQFQFRPHDSEARESGHRPKLLLPDEAAWDPDPYLTGFMQGACPLWAPSGAVLWHILLGLYRVQPDHTAMGSCARLHLGCTVNLHLFGFRSGCILSLPLGQFQVEDITGQLVSVHAYSSECHTWVMRGTGSFLILVNPKAACTT
jgi:hypothetical protein